MKKQNKYSRGHDLFLLMFHLSQITLKDKIITFFIQALHEIWPDINFIYQQSIPDTGKKSFEIHTSGTTFGYIWIENHAEFEDEDQSLLYNAAAMLAVILKKNQQDALLTEDNRQLQRRVQEQISATIASEDRYRTLFENIQDVFYETSIEGSILEVSPSVHSLSGGQYVREDLIGKSLSELFENPETRQDFLLAIQKKGYVNDFEITLKNRDDALVQCSITAKIVFDDSGIPIKIVGTLRDVTERKNTEKALLKSKAGLQDALEIANRSRQMLLSVLEDQRIAENKIKALNAELERRVMERTFQLEASSNELESFSYSVSHDLRAPLRHINGFAEILKKKYSDQLSDEALTYLDTITGAANKMGVLIDDLLSFSRAGRKELKKSTVKMNKVIKEAFTLLQTSVEERTIDWSIPELPAVHGDYNLLLQVWINLLDNAVKYTNTREKAIISIACREEKDNLIFSIQDNGVGFDMKYAPKLFGVFQRLHSSAEFDGTGIGLANVRRIILRHGGETWADAEIDKGATFYFSIPKNA